MKDKELKKICEDLVKIIVDSKATFFGTGKIDTEELLYELKAEICTNCEMYFVNKLNK